MPIIRLGVNIRSHASPRRGFARRTGSASRAPSFLCFSNFVLLSMGRKLFMPNVSVVMLGPGGSGKTKLLKRIVLDEYKVCFLPVL